MMQEFAGRRLMDAAPHGALCPKELPQFDEFHQGYLVQVMTKGNNGDGFSFLRNCCHRNSLQSHFCGAVLVPVVRDLPLGHGVTAE